VKPVKFRKRLKEIERQVGSKISAEILGGGHLRLTIKGCSNVVFCAATPSDTRAQKNIVADIRRAMGK
jgi:hypothetical protein